MNSTKILLLTERKLEDTLMKQIINIYGIAETYNVWSYTVDLFTIYGWLEEEGDLLGETSFIRIFHKHEKKKQMQLLLRQHFSHIVLSYDLNALEYRNNKDKIESLLSYFNQSDGNGKLYLNYPSAEAFFHSEGLMEEELQGCTVTPGEFSLEYYRKKVGREVGLTNWKLFSPEVLHKVLIRNLKQAYGIQHHRCWENMEQEEYRYINFQDVFEKQIVNFQVQEKMAVLCTSIFFALEVVGVRKKELLRVFKTE